MAKWDKLLSITSGVTGSFGHVDFNSNFLAWGDNTGTLHVVNLATGLESYTKSNGSGRTPILSFPRTGEDYLIYGQDGVGTYTKLVVSTGSQVWSSTGVGTQQQYDWQDIADNGDSVRVANSANQIEYWNADGTKKWISPSFGVGTRAASISRNGLYVYGADSSTPAVIRKLSVGDGTFVASSSTGNGQYGRMYAANDGMLYKAGDNGYVTKYDPSLNVVWAKSFGGSSPMGRTIGIDEDNGRGFYFTGGTIYEFSLSDGSVISSLATGKSQSCHDMAYHNGRLALYFDASEVALYDVNRMPNEPTGLTPSGTKTAPYVTTSTTPRLNWSFSDVDAGDSQSAYQIQIFNASGTVIKDTGKIASGNGYYDVPSSILTAGASYSWQVRTYDSYGFAGSYSTPQYLYVNRSPNASTTLTPSGTSTAPGIVRSLTPTLSWTFSDPDAGNSQSAFQVQIFNSSGTLLHDSGQVNSAGSSYVVPNSAGLTPNTLYSWSVRVWDNYGSSSPFATSQFFKTSQAPTATNLTPGSPDSANPEGASVAPRLAWTYTDNESDIQVSYQVKVYNASTGLLVYDSGKVNAATFYQDVPAGVLGAGIKFYWNVTVWDNTGMSSTSANEYLLTNTPPAAVTFVSPTDTYRVGVRPVFVANTGDDPENDKQNFKIQLADNSSFTVNLKEMSTATATTGWEAYNGTAWVTFPSGGVDSTFEGKQVRYTWQSDLTEGKTYYWRIAPIDGTTGTLGNWSSTRTLRVGDTLQFKLKNPTKTTAAAKKIVLTGVRKVATDGTTPSVLKVEVCNNGLDATPTWEDATAYFLNGQTYVFTNTVKTGTDWAVDCRVTIKANDSLGAIEFDGLGFSFS